MQVYHPRRYLVPCTSTQDDRDKALTAPSMLRVLDTGDRPVLTPTSWVSTLVSLPTEWEWKERSEGPPVCWEARGTRQAGAGSTQ